MGLLLARLAIQCTYMMLSALVRVNLYLSRRQLEAEDLAREARAANDADLDE